MDENQKDSVNPVSEAPQDETTQRIRVDRRRRPTPFISRYTFWGRRKAHRRTEDPQANYYVDRVGGKYWAVIILIIVLSVMDSLFTLYHLKRGYREINPLLNAFLFHNYYFLGIKYLLTVIGIISLALHKFFIFVRELIILLIILYIALYIYQVVLYFY